VGLAEFGIPVRFVARRGRGRPARLPAEEFVEALFGTTAPLQHGARPGTTTRRARSCSTGRHQAVDQHNPNLSKPGWVEHDAEIWERRARAACCEGRRPRHDMAAIGITTARDDRRWDRARASRPSGDRTAPERGSRRAARRGSPRRRGSQAGDRRLFLGTKSASSSTRSRAAARRAGELAFGTVDSGCSKADARRVHATDSQRGAHAATTSTAAWDPLRERGSARAVARLKSRRRLRQRRSGVVRRGDPVAGIAGISRRRSSGSAARRRDRPRTPTAPAASC
jgi:hypothetical protein